MSVALYTHPDMLDHRPREGHPERPERLKAVTEALAAARLDLEIRGQGTYRRQAAQGGAVTAGCSGEVGDHDGGARGEGGADLVVGSFLA